MPKSKSYLERTPLCYHNKHEEDDIYLYNCYTKLLSNIKICYTKLQLLYTHGVNILRYNEEQRSSKDQWSYESVVEREKGDSSFIQKLERPFLPQRMKSYDHEKYQTSSSLTVSAHSAS